MPELPDLEVLREVLERRVVGRRIQGVEEPRPLVLRVLDPHVTGSELLAGQTIVSVRRQAKFVVLGTENGALVAINLMLAGRLRLCPEGDRILVRDYVILRLDDGTDLRYNDPRGMGKVYVTRHLDRVPGLRDGVPDAMDPALSAQDFCDRLRHFRGEIKGVLARGALVAGIGNAYADEILFAAGINPFRKRTSLSAEEQVALYDAMRGVLAKAIEHLSELADDTLDVERRDFMQVHNRGGQACPRCGTTISEVKGSRRATSFCRTCQPGSLFRN